MTLEGGSRWGIDENDWSWVDNCWNWEMSTWRIILFCLLSLMYRIFHNTRLFLKAYTGYQKLNIIFLLFAFLLQQSWPSQGQMSGQKPHTGDCNRDSNGHISKNTISISEDLILMEDDKFYFTCVEFQSPSSSRGWKCKALDWRKGRNFWNQLTLPPEKKMRRERLGLGIERFPSSFHSIHS